MDDGNTVQRGKKLNLQLRRHGDSSRYLLPFQRKTATSFSVRRCNSGPSVPQIRWGNINCIKYKTAHIFDSAFIQVTFSLIKVSSEKIQGKCVSFLSNVTKLILSLLHAKGARGRVLWPATSA